jgi:hypothetical protein
MQNRCTPIHADRPESGMVVHGKSRTTAPEEPRRRGGPCPIRVHQRASACICVGSFLLAALRTALCGNATRPRRADRNPMHLYRSPKCHRRPLHHSRPATATTIRRTSPNRSYAEVRWHNPMHQSGEDRPIDRTGGRSVHQNAPAPSATDRDDPCNGGQDPMRQTAPALPATYLDDLHCGGQDPMHQNAPVQSATDLDDLRNGGQDPMQQKASAATRPSPPMWTRSLCHQAPRPSGMAPPAARPRVGKTRCNVTHTPWPMPSHVVAPARAERWSCSRRSRKIQPLAQARGTSTTAAARLLMPGRATAAVNEHAGPDPSARICG